MTTQEMRAALNLGPEWTVIWRGTHPPNTVEHLCGGLFGPGGTYTSEYMTLTFAPAGQPGLEAAWCVRCREAWVRRGGS